MKKIIKKIILIFAASLFVFSCSSKPKNTGDIVTLRTQTEKELAVANREAGRGSYEVARGLLEECSRKAVVTDDWGLIIRCGLSLGNVLFSIGDNEGAFSEWDKAVRLAEKHGNRELLSVSKIYKARGELLSGDSLAQTVLDEVTREAANIKNDKLYLAFSWQVRGLSYRALGSFREAEDALKKSLAIHESEKYLDNASYDWYTIASVRSLAGNTRGAIEALESAIKLDRRAENSWGLAANWRAMGDVYRKAGDTQAADEAYLRAKEIYTAMKKFKEAEEIDKRMEN
jgi:tetratricopeptide (TPR) repeat protein